MLLAQSPSSADANQHSQHQHEEEKKPVAAESLPNAAGTGSSVSAQSVPPSRPPSTAAAALCPSASAQFSLSAASGSSAVCLAGAVRGNSISSRGKSDIGSLIMGAMIASGHRLPTVAAAFGALLYSCTPVFA